MAIADLNDRAPIHTPIMTSMDEQRTMLGRRPLWSGRRTQFRPNPGRRLLLRDGRRGTLAIFGQASRDMRNPISRQHLGFIGLFGAIELPDLLGTALLRSFAIFGSDSIGVDQLLSKGRFTKSDGSQKTQVQK
jgi:hypothetical protein